MPVFTSYDLLLFFFFFQNKDVFIVASLVVHFQGTLDVFQSSRGAPKDCDWKWSVPGYLHIYEPSYCELRTHQVNSPDSSELQMSIMESFPQLIQFDQSVFKAFQSK